MLRCCTTTELHFKERILWVKPLLKCFYVTGNLRTAKISNAWRDNKRIPQLNWYQSITRIRKMTNYVFGGGIERVVTYQFDNSLTHSKAPRSSAVVQNRSKDSKVWGFIPRWGLRTVLCPMNVMRQLPIFPYSNKKLKLPHLSYSPYHVMLMYL